MTRLLEEEGFTALSVGSVGTALMLLEPGTEAIHLVVTDVVMPRLGGIELHRELRRRGSTVPVLFVSGGMTSQLASELGRDARVRFLPKPWMVEELVRVVRQMLDGEPRDGRAPSRAVLLPPDNQEIS